MKVSIDSFIGGKIKIYQPVKGYRAGLDAVLLASTVKTFDKCKLLDVGSGTGVISFCIAYRSNNIFITGIEKNFTYYSLSLKSKKINNLKSIINFSNTDLAYVNNFQYDIVVSNPPWFLKGSTYESDNNLLNDAKIESLDLNIWIQKIYENLNSKGSYYTIFPYNRVDKIVRLLEHYFTLVNIYPISSFLDSAPNKAIIYAKKTGKNKLCKVHNRIIIHKSDNSFKDNVNDVLNKGISFPLA